jgi:hypothetical protein
LDWRSGGYTVAESSPEATRGDGSDSCWPNITITENAGSSTQHDYPDGRVAQILLDNGALPDFEEGDHFTLTRDFEDGPDVGDDILMPALIRAVLRGHTNLVKLLVARGAHINIEYRGWIDELPTWVIGGPLSLAEQIGD